MQNRKERDSDLPPHVFWKKDEWYVRIFIPTSIKNKNGKRKYLQRMSICRPRTEERAAEIVKALTHQMQEVKRLGVTTRSQLKDLVKDFIETKRTSIEPTTYDYYNYLLENQISRLVISDDALVELTPKDIQRAYRNLEADTSGVMVRKVHTLLRMAFKYAVFHDLIHKNPTEGVILPKASRKETQALTKKEAQAFLKVCANDPRYLIFEFGFHTGLRPQEVVGLQWEFVDLDGCKIYVRKAMKEKLNGTDRELGDLKTKASRRTIGISKDLRDKLAEHKNRQDAQKEEWLEKIDQPLLLKRAARGPLYDRRKTARDTAAKRLKNIEEFDLVFPSADGTILDLRNVGRLFREAAKAAKLKSGKYSFKSLRHTCLTILADTLNIKKLMRFAGHSSETTTLKYYLHADDSSVFDASDTMRNALKG